MSDPGAELLRAVLDAPDEDPPRLVYADYLMEKGDPRGELISVQIQLRQRINPARRKRAKRREWDLLSKHRLKIQKELGKIAQGSVFRRGFVDEIRTEGATFANKGHELLEREPVRRARLWNTSTKHIKKALSQGLIGKLAALAIYGDIDASGVRALAESEQLASLEHLNMNIGMGDEAAIALFSSPHLKTRKLGLHNNDLTDAIIDALVQWPGLEACTHLYLARNQLTDHAAQKLAKANMPAMKLLCLGGNEEIGDDGAMAFATPQHAEMIDRLDLEYLELSDTTEEQLREHWGRRVKLVQY